VFGDGALTFREFIMREPLPLATIHEAVLEFLRGRTDAALYGAQAVNAYVDEPRMTQDVDLLSTRAADLAEEIRAALNAQFQIAVRVREAKEGIGYRIYQLREPKNRHLVDVRQVESLPPTRSIDDVQVLAPVELICAKVQSMTGRPQTAKGLIDEADLRRLLLAFPEYKTEEGTVRERLVELGASHEAFVAWQKAAMQEILRDKDQ
jgi:hypothetical protein